ncbi:maleylpyruvate isomerase family mycothiol-dependent enzyme [Serinicoccus sp. LYQ131]|uniref:maleylpyruvate isomerase family mycothiol-dependent enzyme n=1 Tax=Serinicoccus sp. LYQ131 TaxID=3378797 RepID=UPI0038536271
MAPARESSLELLEVGTDLWEDALAALSDQDLTGLSTLPGWSRAHVVAHVALNAVALTNLVSWARTGVVTPMYASPQARDADIEALSLRPAAELREASARAALGLREGLAAMPRRAWARKVRVRQGTEVEATVIPWLRVREVFLHALDLGSGVTDADLPEVFADLVVGDVVRQRSRVQGHPRLHLRADPGDARWDIGAPGPEDPVVVGDVRALAAYVSGRAATLPLRRTDGAGADVDADATGGAGFAPPELPPWL